MHAQRQTPTRAAHQMESNGKVQRPSVAKAVDERLDDEGSKELAYPLLMVSLGIIVVAFGPTIEVMTARRSGCRVYRPLAAG